MIFAYLDEFGHIGPYCGRSHPTYNESPVFGVAGILLPEYAVRSFATYFLHRKTELLGRDIAASGKPAFKWEKKGTNLFTPKSIDKYPEIRRTAFRLINAVMSHGGRIFFCGRQKSKGREDVNANGLYTTVFADALRQLDKSCATIDENFVVVVDEHSARKQLLDTAAKTMFGSEPARRLASPPFEVESYLNQNVQAADWMATIIGRIWSYRLDPEEFAMMQPYEAYFASRIEAASSFSTVRLRRPPRQVAQVTQVTQVSTLGVALLEAGVSLRKR